jgi:uncharacterized protein YdiU (UPF0061 family)
MKATPVFENSYIRLPKHFYSKTTPSPVKAPVAIVVNHHLGNQLGLEHDWLNSPKAIQVLSGNSIASGSEPIAQAYAGHQFGNFNPNLGDGRAVLLGELISLEGNRYDLQLKGSGKTRFSRQGDGRSPIGPVIREYIVSEAMAALGVPTTRSLMAIASGEAVYRQRLLPGAILSRIAPSHIRIGTFEYFGRRGDIKSVRCLADYTIERHFVVLTKGENRYLGLLQQAITLQAKLIAQWQGLGFIHGVMNTDNMLICGATIDYGPCAFMDQYQANKVFSSIDAAGRYAYDQQPNIGQWNLSRLAQTLLPLLHKDMSQAIAMAQQAIAAYPTQYEYAYQQVMNNKLGFTRQQPENQLLIDELLSVMNLYKLDFSLCFRYLTDLVGQDDPRHKLQAGLFQPPIPLLHWIDKWQQRLQQENNHQFDQQTERLLRMKSANPAFIPRNHQIEATIRAAEDEHDFKPMHQLIEVLSQPQEYRSQQENYAAAPLPHERVAKTYCGT